MELAANMHAQWARRSSEKECQCFRGSQADLGGRVSNVERIIIAAQLFVASCHEKLISMYLHTISNIPRYLYRHNVYLKHFIHFYHMQVTPTNVHPSWRMLSSLIRHVRSSSLAF